MADETIFQQTLVSSGPITDHANKYLAGHDQTAVASFRIPLSVALDANEHIVDPSGMDFTSSTNVQGALDDIDAAIVSERTQVQNGGATLNDGAPTLNFSASFFTLTESPADDFAIVIADDGITTVKILDANVTNAKLADAAAYTLKGRNAGTTGVPSDFTIGSLTEKGSPVAGDFFLVTDGAASNAFKKADVGDLPFNNYTHPNHTGDVTSVADGATTIADEAVTNAKLAHASAWTFKVRNAGSTGDPSDAALADVTTEASPADGDFLVGFLDTGEIRKFDANNFLNASATLKPQIALLPAAAELPTSNAAAKSSHSTTAYERPVLLYDDSTDEAAAWTGVLPDSYGGGGLSVDIIWGSAGGVTTGNVVWAAAIESTTPDGDSLNTDNFAADNTVTDAAPASANNSVTAAITFTDGADMDSLAAGEMYRVRLTRDADNASDTMSGDAEVYAVYVREP